MRSLIILLSLTVFFLTGLIVGMDRSSQENTGDQRVDEMAMQEEQEIVREINSGEENPADKEVVMSPEAPEHFTYKAASFLESSVKRFYELIVGALYQLTQAFF
ncbi:hypothetical protein [Lentibacillus salicampi]|uniref:DUF3679 domain-containing protein n=1 Tax=Lentibacillus salicampi TaxID=175306 RepID=A0A4Y9AI30_9BACI|nr:hypothetical protein [Lentibacillus salicampi]TFJ94064.1 hypothetical protein E4U82_04420 [Lentibacillus salicampi]